MNDKDKLYKKLEDYRIQHEMSKQELCDQVGVPLSYYAMIKNGTSGLKITRKFKDFVNDKIVTETIKSENFKKTQTRRIIKNKIIRK